jgi:hypothetical protein
MLLRLQNLPVEETGFLRQILHLPETVIQKLGFLATSPQKPGFCDKFCTRPKQLFRNPVS